jgi:hypothetical protein
MKDNCASMSSDARGRTAEELVLILEKQQSIITAHNQLQDAAAETSF